MGTRTAGHRLDTALLTAAHLFVILLYIVTPLSARGLFPIVLGQRKCHPMTPLTCTMHGQWTLDVLSRLNYGVICGKLGNPETSARDMRPALQRRPELTPARELRHAMGLAAPPRLVSLS